MEDNINELSHHGIRGMKWGIRRFQNKDGSLTNMGRKRRIQLEGKAKYMEMKMRFKKDPSKDYKPKGNPKQSNKQAPKPQRTIKDLSNDELRERTTRMRLESDYIDANRRLSSLQPEKVSRGRKFVSYVGSNVIKPAATEAGKNLLKDWLIKKGTDSLGLKDMDELASLRKEVDLLELKKRKVAARNYIKKNNNK